MLEEDELRRRSGRLCGWWRERVSHLSDGHRRMLHEQPSAAAVALVAKRGKERDAARAGRGRDVVRVPIDVVNQRRGGLVERALWALVELAERVALAHLKRWLLLRPRRLRASCRRRWHGWRGGTDRQTSYPKANTEIHIVLPEVREFIRRHTAYNKHDTGWAKGAPSEDHTTPLFSEVLASEKFPRILGGIKHGLACILSLYLIL